MAKKKYEYDTSEWLEYYQKLADKNERAYQDSGLVKYDNLRYQYQEIADAFQAKLEKEEARRKQKND